MSRTRILVVEDETIVALDVKQRLMDLGYEVTGVAERGDQALELVAATCPNLVLMDIRLKGEMDGIAAAEAIRRRWRIPVIYLTAFSEERTLQRAKVTEPFGYIIKPFEDREIQWAIEMALYKHQAEERLRESEARYRLLAENTSDVVWLLDLNSGQFEYVSPSVERLRGFTADEVMAQSMAEVMTPESYRKTVEPLSARLAAFTAGDESMRMRVIEVDQPCKNGQVVTTEILTALISGEDGQVVKIAGSSRDITHRKKLEEALRKSRNELEVRVEERTAELEAVNVNLQREILIRVQAQEEAVLKTEELKKSQTRLQSVFDGITDPLVMLDQDLKVIVLNRAAMGYFGKKDIQKVIERPCFEAFRDAAGLCPDCQIAQAVASEAPFQYERAGLMDPHRWENVMAYPLREEEDGFKGVLLRISDITEKKLAENQLIQRQKMEALGILISGIAHEINNPNNFISFNMPILRDYLSALLLLTDVTARTRPELDFFGMTYPEFREDVFRLLENVRNGSDRINAIVSQLKTFSRKKGSLELRETDLGEVVDRVIALSKNQVAKTVHSLDVALAEHLPLVRTDPEALVQVLLNLLINRGPGGRQA